MGNEDNFTNSKTLQVLKIKIDNFWILDDFQLVDIKQKARMP